MKDRLIQLRNSLGLSQGEFGKKIKKTDPMISMYESGKKVPPDGVIDLICHTFGVSKKWLTDGEGEMMDDELSTREKRLHELFTNLSPTAQDLLIASAQGMVDQQEKQKNE